MKHPRSHGLVRVSLFVLAALLITFFGVQYAQNPERKKLDVILKAPQGSTEGRREALEILAGFNQPMVALQGVPIDQGSGPVRTEPPLKGKYRWRGTTVLSFTPQDSLPWSTPYKVIVPAGTRSLSGAVLDKEVSWSFETPRPVLMSTMPGYQQHFVELDHSVAFNFTQPMDPAKAQKFFKLTEDDRKGHKSDIPFTVRSLTAEEAKTRNNKAANGLVLLPQRKYNRQTTIRVNLAPGLLGAQGTLGLALERSIEFYTYNPFKFGWITASDNVDPEGWLGFHFSNPVDRKEFIKNITITPAVSLPKINAQGRLDEDDYYGEYGDSVQSLNLKMKPESKYSIKISGQLKDRFGQVLGRDTTLTITTGSYHPTFYIPAGMGVIEAYGDLKVPVILMNCSAVRRQAALVPASQVVPLLKDGTALSGWAERVTYADSLKWALDGTWRFDIKNNVRKTTPFNLKPLLGLGGYGFVYLNLDSLPPWGEYGDDNFYDPHRHDRAFFQVTSLGLTAKFSPENNLIWVTSLKDSRPVPGAKVALRDDNNRILFTGFTDSTGCLMAPGWEKLGLKQREPSDDEDYYYSQRPRIWVFASLGQDKAMLVSDWGMGIEPYEFGLSYDWDPRPVQYQGHIFTERGLYRAGEKVFIKGVFREKRQGQWAIPLLKTVTLTIRDSRDGELVNKRVKLSEWGAFEYTLNLKPEAATGYYSVRAQNGNKISSYVSFRVEAFKPAQFEVTASSDREQYFAGENFSGQVNAKYLFGSPMAGEKASWAIRIAPYQFIPPGREDYSFGSYWWWDDYRDQTKLLASKDSLLDAQGVLKASAKLDLKDYKSSAAITLEGTAINVSRQSQSGRCQAIVHRGKYYIGLKQNKGFLEPKDTLKLSLITVTPEGAVLPDRQLMVKIIKREWRSVRKAGQGGRYEWLTEKTETEVARFDLTTGGQPKQITYQPTAPGFYLVRAMGMDDQSNRIITDGDFYATGPGYVSWEMRNDDRIDLVSDKTMYQPGQTARIMIKSPYPKTRALITIEREYIIQRWVQELEGSAPTIEIPIKNEYLPNIFVSVILLQGRQTPQKYSEKGDDISKPSFKIGYLNLPVDPGTKSLRVKVDCDRPEYRPRDSVTVTVDVKNYRDQGVPSEVTLAVVDKGVLNLIDFKTPNSFDSFYGPRPLSVATAETRLHVIGQRNYGEKGENRGGGGGLEAAFRGEFLTTAYYNAKLLTDSSGRATIRFRLPDNLTTFKIMATVQTKQSEFGAAEKTFMVNKPLLLLEAMPRFLRLGDKFMAGVTIHNKTGEERQVQITASAQSVKLNGPAEQSVSVKPNQAQEVRFNFTAQQLGTAVFKFSARSSDFSDGLEIKLPVQMPKLTETAALYSRTEGSALEAVNIPEDIMPGLGQLSFSLSSTALSGLETSLDYLVGYPYGCLEQRLSKILPMIEAGPLIEDFKLAPLKGRDIKKIIKKELAEVPQFQLEDGGFSYWKDGEYRCSSPYLTAYAMDALYRAKTAGYPVDQAVTDAAISYLKTALGWMASNTDWQWPYSISIRYTCLSYTCYVLGLWGQPQSDYLNRLYDKRDQMSYFGKAMLLRALHLKGGNLKMEQELTRSLVNKIKLSSSTAHFEEDEDRSGGWIFQSNVRTTALILTTLLETSNGFEHSEKVIRWLTDKRKKGRWNNTQDNIYVFQAFRTYYQLYEKDEPSFTASIKLENKEILKEAFQGRSLGVKRKELPLNKLAKGKDLPLNIGKQGPGQLYYGVKLTYAPAQPVKMRDEGLAVFRQIMAVNSREPAKEFIAGQVYKVTLNVVTPYERNYVVLDDPLPAGFEVINTSFATESKELQRQMREGEQDRNRRWWGSFNHFEIHDDRVLLFADDLLAGEHTYSYYVRASTAGTFYHPSAKAEEMYNPEVFGWCEDRVIIIK